MASKSTYEKKLERLSELSTILERGEAPLEELLKVFEEGIKLYRECNTILESTEAKIQTILTNEEAENAN
ncbi:exodeoxyribonuclease VII small subunit [Fusibacter bizertensis]|jgi:Exonuclease VII small subunit.|uniref:Exodeoxyribonuclease 7 small subunit n=1 Tax=Fusibacter bizertensis TaxID=1488331 RepID=A0ABT6N9K5_9FIRM|nr:exodeoxyribonuclease VII small subunit [Fusibacter bizertensis]MDH8677079.1 exodeoxyribonuclease VII small subunit [Fusibacter bizertensis]